jgi:hypothetical protein
MSDLVEVKAHTTATTTVDRSTTPRRSIETRIELLTAPDRLVVRTFDRFRPDPEGRPHYYVTDYVDHVYVREDIVKDES